jgi:DNA-directed RNA polymerase specialized sigma24 family protein
MSAGDNTADHRWRPDLDSSRRRVREEEEEERLTEESKPTPVRFSRELSFVPNNRRLPGETGNAETRAMIRRYRQLEELPNGAKVIERLEEWKWPWAGRSAADKQRFLEPLIAEVRRDARGNEDVVLLLLVVFEGVRRSVSSAFRRACSGLRPPERDINWSNRAEAKMLRHIERERLEDVTRTAVISAILSYPAQSPASLFGWLRETIAHRALDELRAELPDFSDTRLDAPEARAIEAFLDLVPHLDVPEADVEGPRDRGIVGDARRLYGIVDHFYDHEPVRDACREAIGRLPRKRGEVMEALYLREIDAATLAATRGVALSTIHNTSSKGRADLREDDSFFLRLHALGIVRGRARAQAIKTRYPDGLLPDGRRIVVIEDAA